MFEARLTQGKVFKQLIEALKDLVQEANIDCSDDEISIQAMDNSHVALVAVSLRSGGFDHYRCDRALSLGFNATNMGKILKCAGNDDVITLKAKDDGDALELVFESPSQDRIADFGECARCLFAEIGGELGWIGFAWCTTVHCLSSRSLEMVHVGALSHRHCYAFIWSRSEAGAATNVLRRDTACPQRR